MKTESAQPNESNLPACIEKLVLNKINLPLNWQSANVNYICSSTATTYMVDFSLVPEVNSAKWLKDNGRHIDFVQSHDYIRKTHEIAAPNPAPTYFRKKYSELRNLVGQNAFDTDAYYLYLYIDFSTNNVILSYDQEFSNERFCHSIPFFRSLNSLYGGSGDFDLNFGTVSGRNFIKIGTAYFDISTNPL